MPDLLILGNDPKSSGAIEEIARGKSFRVKSAFDLKSARGWLETGSFDAFFVHSDWPFEEQQVLASLLWEKNALAEFLIFSFDEKTPSQFTEQRLFGAYLAFGDRALEVMSRLLDRTKPKGLVRSDEVQILVVEDLDSPRDIICSYIEKLGYPNTRGVASAKEALHVLKSSQRNLNCIITDLRMPDMSGKELIEQVRATDDLAGIPIVVLTAYGGADQLVDCILAGASGFLTKPPKKSDLLREIQRAVRISACNGDPRLIDPSQEVALRNLLREQGIV